eukprot:2129226-Amphidinium_carterae.1
MDCSSLALAPYYGLQLSTVKARVISKTSFNENLDVMEWRIFSEASCCIAASRSCSAVSACARSPSSSC